MGSSQLENLWHKLCPKCSLEIPGRTWLRLLCLPGKAALLHTETGQFRKALDAGAFPGFSPLGSTSFISPCCSLSPDCSPELFLILPSPFCSPRWTVGLPCLPQMKQPRPFQSFPKGCVCSPLQQRFQPSAAALAQFVSFVGEKDKPHSQKGREDGLGGGNPTGLCLHRDQQPCSRFSAIPSEDELSCQLGMRFCKVIPVAAPGTSKRSSRAAFP